MVQPIYQDTRMYLKNRIDQLIDNISVIDREAGDQFAELGQRSQRLTWQYHSLVHMLGTGSKELNLSEFQARLDQVMKLADCKDVSSYIWVEDGEFQYSWPDIERILGRQPIDQETLATLVEIVGLLETRAINGVEEPLELLRLLCLEERGYITVDRSEGGVILLNVDVILADESWAKNRKLFSEAEMALIIEYVTAQEAKARREAFDEQIEWLKSQEVYGVAYQTGFDVYIGLYEAGYEGLAEVYLAKHVELMEQYQANRVNVELLTEMQNTMLGALAELEAFPLIEKNTEQARKYLAENKPDQEYTEDEIALVGVLLYLGKEINDKDIMSQYLVEVSPVGDGIANGLYGHRGVLVPLALYPTKETREMLAQGNRLSPIAGGLLFIGAASGDYTRVKQEQWNAQSMLKPRANYGEVYGKAFADVNGVGESTRRLTINGKTYEVKVGPNVKDSTWSDKGPGKPQKLDEIYSNIEKIRNGEIKLKYDERTLSRMIEDGGKNHNIPEMLTDDILSSEPYLVRSDGRVEFLMKGEISGTEGVFHITVQGDTIKHSYFSPKNDWARFSNRWSLPSWDNLD